MNIYKTWTNLKSLFIAKNLLLQYTEEQYKYIIFVTEDSITNYVTELWKNTSQIEGIDIVQNNIDLIDFETNYKTDANKSYYLAGQLINVNVTGGNVTVSSIVNDSNIFLSDIFTIVSKNEATIRTYIVPIGKIFRLVAWQVNADHPLALDILLKLNGVSKVKFYLDPSTGHNSDYIYTAPVPFATAGQVITITVDPTMPRGEVNSILVGIESNA
jgi:hypothetical protein